MHQHTVTIGRRGFLKACGWVSGALLVQVTVPATPRAKSSGSATLNAYVSIDRSGRVALIMPKIEMGQGTYTSLPMLVAEELEVSLESIEVLAAPPNPEVYGFQGDQSTGGSTTIRLCWTPLRKAGAAARTMLMMAAARRWRVDPASLSAQSGSIIHNPTGRQLTYGELAAAAASEAVPADPPLKPQTAFRLIGKPTHRRDALQKTNGSAIFGIDVQLPGMRIAMLEIAPTQGGRVMEPLREQAALAISGVRQVVNERDVVAVIADDTWAALKGLQALQLAWHDGPHGSIQQTDIVSALETAAHSSGAVAVKTGDPYARTHAGGKTVAALYHQPFLAHATMEPMNCVVHYRADACEIWTGTQAPDRAVAKLVDLGLKPEHIQLHNQLIGGGFGRRLEVDGIVYGVRIARHVTTPVKVLWTREQDIQHDLYRPYYVDRICAELDERGRPVAWRHTIAGSAVSAVYSGEPLKNGVDDDAVDCAADPVYRLDNREVRFAQHEPPGVPTTWWRGVGPTRSVFVVESFIDELAAAAAQDPVLYRRSLLKSERMRAALDKAAQEAGWEKPLPAGRGRGVAIQYAFGSYLAQIVEVRVEDGQVELDRVVCALDCGQLVNPDTVRAQLEGGALFGLGAALYNEITIHAGRVQQSNFHDFPALRISQAPKVETHLIASTESPGGVGETATACAAAALCNAIFVATGKRIRTLPVSRGLRQSA